MNILSIDQIRHQAPSVFAEMPAASRSENYRFYPTSKVLEGLLNHGFLPVYAGQSKTRDINNMNFTRHVMRFRHGDLLSQGGDEIPEIVVMNSHNGSSCYKIMLGFFRLVCANGIIAASNKFNEISIRHSGKPTIVGEVIEGSFEIIKSAPLAAQQIAEWKGIELNYEQSHHFAEAANVLRDSHIEIAPSELLTIRRPEDAGNDLWRTYNRVQENIIKGGVTGHNPVRNTTRHTRAVKSIAADVKLNRALWLLAEKMAGYTNPQQLAA